MGGHAFPSGYDSEHRSLHLSMKLFNRTPGDLPSDLRSQVWINSVDVWMYGCVDGWVHFINFHT